MSRLYIAIICLILGGFAGAFIAAPVINGQANAPGAAVIPKELTSYRDVVKKVLPAVVSIEFKGKAAAQKPGAPRRGPQQDDGDDGPRSPFDDEDFPRHSFGSGFLVDPKGVVMTNHHVVNGADQVEITLQDGRKFTSKDIRSDAKTDLAVVRFESTGALPYLEFGDSTQMEQGDRVLAVGAPFGLMGSVTSGIVSAKGRSLNVKPISYEDFLQTDAAINPGNSGGPLVNLEGKVVGINSAIKSRTGGFQGVGLAIASNLAKDVKDKLLRDGVVRRGYLGVQMKDLLDKEIARRLGVEAEGGVVISRAYDNAPAAKAGIKGGDVITAFAGKPIREGKMLQNMVADLPLGKPIDATVVRDGKPQDIKITIEEMPANYGNDRTPFPRIPKPDSTAITLSSIGADVMDLNEDLAKEMGLKDLTSGAVVVRVRRDTPAAEAGMFPGMVITKADKNAITSAMELRDAIKGGALKEGVLLRGQSVTTGTVFSLVKAPEAASK